MSVLRSTLSGDPAGASVVLPGDGGGLLPVVVVVVYETAVSFGRHDSSVSQLSPLRNISYLVGVVSVVQIQ